MSKHTPGPWRTFNGTDIFPDDDDREGQRHIADCDMAGSIGGDEQRANARLIAAAPELLKALQVIAATLPHMGGSERSTHSLLAQATAAISKATTPPVSDNQGGVDV